MTTPAQMSHALSVQRLMDRPSHLALNCCMHSKNLIRELEDQNKFLRVAIFNYQTHDLVIAGGKSYPLHRNPTQEEMAQRAIQ